MRLIVVKAPQFVLLLSLILTFWIYAPGRAEVLILDDLYSIVGVDLHNGMEQSLLQRVEASGSGGPTGRPVSTVTFVVESVYLQTSIAQRKTVNIVLHLANSILVFVLLSQLFRAATYLRPEWLALTFTVLWMLSPALVSTTLYLVQRMSLLATFFVLWGCIAYLYWRGQYIGGGGRWIQIVPVLVFFILAVFSKENGLLLLPIIAAIELCWFRDESLKYDRVATLHRVFVWTVAVFAVVGVVVVIYFYPFLREGFESRDFSMSERLLTQSRVLWDYVFQFVIPNIRAMGIYHDDWTLSTGILSPRSTIWSILGWIAMVGLGVILWCRNVIPRLSLGVCFFLIAHSLEATILPLELYFEHRNYLPSIGLIIFGGVALGEVSKRWGAVVPPVLAWAGVWCVVLASQTGILAQIWSSNRLLAFHHVNGHPDSFRANGDIAFLMASVGDHELALKYSAAANSAIAESDLDYVIRDLTLGCISSKELPFTHWSRVEGGSQHLVLHSATGLHQYLRQVSGNECDVEESRRIADVIEGVLLDEFDRLGKTSNDVLFLLARLDIELEVYERSLRYLSVLLARNHDVEMYQVLNKKVLGLLDERDSLN